MRRRRPTAKCSLETTAAPRNRDVEAEKARERARERFG
jgi:hypothetical protein